MKNLWKKALPLLLCLVTLLCIAPMAYAAEEEPEMKSSENFINVLKEMEGFSAKPYWDVNHYSIGYGTTCPSDKVSYYTKNPLTEKEAEEWLRESLVGYEEDVIKYAKKHDLKLKQHQFDALVSFTYNCGGSWTGELNGYFNTAVRSGDTGNMFLYGICLYGSSAGNYVLINRRLCEANMYINGEYKAYNKGDAYPSNYKWVFLNGGGATPRYPIYAYDSKKAEPIEIRFSDIPTGTTEDGETFVYTFAGWYTEDGKKVSKADSSLTNGQILYARWKDPDGKVVTLPTGTPVTKQTVTVTSSSANMRKGPGTYYAKSGTQKKGTKLTLTEVYTVGSTTWGKTNKGWTSLSNTDYEAPAEVEFPQKATVNTNGVNYRTGPGTSYKKKGEYDKGTKITITKLSDSGTWGKMSNDYWIHMDYVTYDKDKVTKVQLIKKPTVLDYEDHKVPLDLEGSVVLLTYADGRQQAKTIARSDVKDGRTAASTTAKITATYGGKSVSFVVTITARTPLKIKTQPKNTAVDMGSTAKVTVKAGGDGLKYRWYIAEPGSKTYTKTSVTTASYSVTMDKELSGSKVYCRVTDKYGNSVKSKAVTLTGNAVISKQPAKASAALDSKVSTTVKVNGVGLKYQWYYKDTSAKKYSKSSTKTATYSTTMTEKRSGRQVYCVITDKYGNTLKTKTVTLTAKVKLTKQPTGESVAVGSRAAATVKATGLGLKYQWYYASLGSDTFKKASATGTKYTITMKESVAGRRAYCVVTDKYGNSVKSNVVTFTIKTSAANKAKITKQPANVAVAMDSKATVSVKATGKGLKYQWYYANEGSGTYKKADATGTKYAVTMSDKTSGRKVYCVVMDKYGNSVKSKVVTLSSKVKITKQPANVAVAMDSKATVSVKATGKGLKYQWYYANEGSDTYKKSSATGAKYTVTMNDKHSGRKVYCVVTDKYGNSVKSKAVTLSSKVKITKQPTNVSGLWGSKVKVTVQASGKGLKYQWYYAGEGSTTFKKSSVKSANYHVAADAVHCGRQLYCVVTDKYGNSVTTKTVTIIAKPVITQQPADVSTAMGNALTVSVTAAGKELAYQWYFAAPGSDTYEKTGVADAAYSLVMDKDHSGSKVYCVVTDKYGNSVKSETATLTGIDVAAELRQQLANRAETIEITYLQDMLLPEDSTVAVDRFQDAVAHTGVSNQGDYIVNHLKRLGYDSSCVAEDARYRVTLTYTAQYRTTADQEAQVDARVKEILDQLNVYNGTDHEKTKAVYDYLCGNVTVVYAIPGVLDPAPAAHTAYGALVEREAVCQGMANAFYRLMLELNVDARIISGKIGDTGHGWNIVAIDGVYYNVDATKDAGFTPDSYNYFLKADSSLTKHVRDEAYCTDAFREAYPVAESDYQ